MSQFSTEFVIDEVSYLLSSNCNQGQWPVLLERVQKFIITHGKQAADSMFGLSAKADGKTKINGEIVSFNLTVNPQGNNFAN